MIRKIPNSPRHMWTKEEDDLLKKVVKAHSNSTWKEIAYELNNANKKIKKTGKQCRERFRNYLDISVINKTWTRDEKILFMLLHSVYGNRWGEIAKFYPNKNDLLMKNFFYSYMRKILKKIRNRANNLYKPRRAWKALYFFYMIDLINMKYLPRLQKSEVRNAQATQDITILDVVKTSGQNEKMLTKFKGKVIRKLMSESKAEDLPIIISISSEKFCWSYTRKKTLNGIIKRQNFGELSQLFKIQTTESLSDQQPRSTPFQSIGPPLIPFHLPPPSLSPYIYPETSAHQMTTSSLQPMMSSLKIPIHPKSAFIEHLEEEKLSVQTNSNVFSPVFLPQPAPLVPQIYAESLVYPIYPIYVLNGFCVHPIGGKIKQWSGFKEEGGEVIKDRKERQTRGNL